MISAPASIIIIFFCPPPRWGGLDLNSSNRGCARLGGEVDPPLGVVVEEVAVLVVLVRRHRRAVGAAVRRAVDDEVPIKIMFLIARYDAGLRNKYPDFCRLQIRLKVHVEGRFRQGFFYRHEQLKILVHAELMIVIIGHDGAV